MQSADLGLAALRLPLAFPSAAAKILGYLECLETLPSRALLSNLAQQGRETNNSTLEENRRHAELVRWLEILPGHPSLRGQIDRYDGEINGPGDRSYDTLLVFNSEPKRSVF